jgi:hypothetical protein
VIGAELDKGRTTVQLPATAFERGLEPLETI